MIKVSIINDLLKESKEKDIFILNEINERKLDTTQEEIIKYLLSTYTIEDEWTNGSDRYDDYFSKIKLKNGEY